MANSLALLTVLADPTRQALVDALRNGPRTVTDLATTVPVTQSAVSQHLQVLKACGLVKLNRRGTRRYYHLDPNRLGELRAYVESLWEDALGSMAAAAKAARDSPK
jgi:DNA-binding transcriptional ArsR family regulator